MLAGTSVLGLAFIFFHYFMMHSMFDNPHFFDQMQAQAKQQHQPVPPFNPQQFFRHFHLVLYVFFGGWSLLSLLGNLAAGFCLLGYRARTFCLVVAGFNCVNMPLGTILGVFTIVVLLRPAVTARFASSGMPGDHPPF